MSDDLVILCKYNSLGEAQLAQGWLEASGITSMIRTDDCGGMYPQFQAIRGVRLIVGPADEAAARELLAGDVAEG